MSKPLSGPSSLPLLPRWRRAAGAASLALTLGMAAIAPARAAQNDASLISALSLLPVAVSVMAPTAVLVGGAQLSVKAVESTAQGTLLVLERLSDGAQASVTLTGRALDRASVKIGTVCETSAIGAGLILSAAGQVIAFVPSEIGRALMHHEPIRP